MAASGWRSRRLRLHVVVAEHRWNTTNPNAAPQARPDPSPGLTRLKRQRAAGSRLKHRFIARAWRQTTSSGDGTGVNGFQPAFIFLHINISEGPYRLNTVPVSMALLLAFTLYYAFALPALAQFNTCRSKRAATGIQQLG